jgi:KipI family sensor histidine kinase inhibitor
MVAEDDFCWFSERHLRVRPAGSVRRAASALAHLPGVIDVVASSQTLLLTLDLRVIDADNIIHAVRGVLERPGMRPSIDWALVRIPVCYHPAVAPDLEEAASQCGLSIPSFIELHSTPTYQVDFVGFMPGFGYLSGLPEKIQLPRLNSPRARVPKGSVAIADAMTGVYPSESPGGWRLIGRTPAVMFDPSRPKPSVLNIGDRVMFDPIDLDKYRTCAGES